MPIRGTICAVLLLLSPVFYSFANDRGNQDSISVYAVMDKAIEARGGREFLQSVKTLSTVTRTVSGGIELNLLVKEMSPNKGSFQIAQNNRLIYQSWFDGHDGFEIVKGVKKKMVAHENKDRPYKKNIFNELDYINPSLWKLVMEGEETVLNELCYKIRATLINGTTKFLYYNKQSFLLIKEENLSLPPEEVFANFIYLTYKKKGKLLYPHLMKYGESGKLKDAEVIDVIINEGVEEGDFR